MPLTLVFDIALLLILLGALVGGARRGFSQSAGGMLGLVVGGVVAYAAIPFVNRVVPGAEWRPVAVIGVVVVLLLVGNSLGSSIGARVQGRMRRRGTLHTIDRVLGAAVNTVFAALIASLLAGGVAGLGIPVLSPALASSSVIRTVESLTPAPLQRLLAQTRTFAFDEGIPSIAGALQPGTSIEIPDLDTQTPALQQAAQSVVRITGNAYACGQSQTGTGFVAADGRVVTNAHVLAGVDAPVVEVPGGGAYTGRIVYFDPVDDLAVIAVDDLPTAPLGSGAVLEPGVDAVVDGYPYGGPFTTGPASVVSVDPLIVPDITGGGGTEREVYTLAAIVRPGNSGGPLLTLDGQVAGVVFATSSTADDVGYAMTMTEAGPVIAQAPSLVDAVDSGACTTD